MSHSLKCQDRAEHWASFSRWALSGFFSTVLKNVQTLGKTATLITVTFYSANQSQRRRGGTNTNQPSHPASNMTVNIVCLRVLMSLLDWIARLPLLLIWKIMLGVTLHSQHVCHGKGKERMWRVAKYGVPYLEFVLCICWKRITAGGLSLYLGLSHYSA